MMGRPLTSTVWMIYLLLWSPGGLGQRVVKPATHQVVIGMLGQSVTLPGNGLGGISTSWDFSMLHMKKKVEVCVKYPKIPPECKRKTVRLNLEDNSLEIWNLTQSDQGLYELRVRTNESLYENAMELRVYERVSTPVINVTAVYSDVVCNATLRCLLEGGTAAVYSWWTRDGEVTEDVSHMLFEDGRSLALSLGLQHNHKVYSCNVRNPVSEANGSVDLAEHCLWDEVSNTEARSSSTEYSMIGRPNRGWDQPQRNLCQLDDGEGGHREGAQLTTVYNEIKWHPGEPSSRAAAERDGVNTQCSKPGT
ncbi:signaling lymphocytic activation molecule-like isoform X2 [Narcine bancroftii]|uniref:signaling lymphocytic activation molecule-like isoform X2 n=1 Tax=Narcine bancroftii TaxID=1343680 RepID=UPI0038312BB5